MSNTSPRHARLAWKVIPVLTCLIGLSSATGAVAQQANDAAPQQLDCSDAPPQGIALLCAQQDFEEVDTKLNAVYQKLKAKRDKDDAKRLVDAQRAWLAYVKADCLFSVGDPPPIDTVGSASTLHGLQLTNCKLGHWTARLKILEQYAQDTP